MKTFILFFATLGTLAVSGLAQHEGHDPTVAAPSAAATARAAEQAKQGMPGEGMKPDMKNEMAKMMAAKMGRGEADKLLDQVMASFAVMDSEKDRKALKKELVAHGDLLKRLQTAMKEQAAKEDKREEMMHRHMEAMMEHAGTIEDHSEAQSKPDPAGEHKH